MTNEQLLQTLVGILALVMGAISVGLAIP